MDDDNQKSELVDRVCRRIGDRYLARDAGTPGWWSPLLGRVMPDDTVAVRGPWPLQRHFLAQVVAGFRPRDEATLRGPTALLEKVIEEALTLRAGLARERVRLGFLDTSHWEALAMAAGATVGVAFRVKGVDALDGIELQSGARWCFGAHVPHPDVEIEVLTIDDHIHLDALDGRCMPPIRRRARLRRDRQPSCDADDAGLLIAAGDNHDDDEEEEEEEERTRLLSRGD